MTDAPWTPWELVERWDEVYGPVVEQGDKVICAVERHYDESGDEVLLDDAHLIAAAPDLANALEEVVTLLEGTEEYATSHGTHFVAIEARKLLTRLRTK